MADELARMKKEVHKYLDAIWLVSSHKKSARTAMYNWLAIQMNLEREETHISLFTLEQCKKALTILKPRYKQMYGRNNIPKEKKKDVINKKKVGKKIDNNNKKR